MTRRGVDDNDSSIRDFKGDSISNMNLSTDSLNSFWNSSGGRPFISAADKHSGSSPHITASAAAFQALFPPAPESPGGARGTTRWELVSDRCEGAG